MSYVSKRWRTGGRVSQRATAFARWRPHSGIAPVSLRRWAQDPRFRAVQVVADPVPAPARLVVILDATGVRVEGVDVETVGAADRAAAMRWAGRRVAVYAHGAPTDMRKGFDSLCGMVTERLARNPLSGDVFLFVSRDRIRAKVLHFDGTGLCLVCEAPGARAVRGAVAGRGRRSDDAHRQRARSVSRWQRPRGPDAAHPAAADAVFACLGSPADDLLPGIVVPLAEERDVDTLRQISLLLERENQRLITKNLQLTAELARLRGLPEVAQLTFVVEQTLQQTRDGDPRRRGGAAVGAAAARAAGPRAPRATGLADRRGAARAAGGSARDARPAAAP